MNLMFPFKRVTSTAVVCVKTKLFKMQDCSEKIQRGQCQPVLMIQIYSLLALVYNIVFSQRAIDGSLLGV